MVIKCILFTLAGENNSFLDPQDNKNECKIEKPLIFLLMGHKVHFISPCGANKSIFYLSVEKNRVQQRKNIYFL